MTRTGSGSRVGTQHASVQEPLRALDDQRRQEPPPLHLREVTRGDPARLQRRGQQARGRHRVLYRQVDTDATDG